MRYAAETGRLLYEVRGLTFPTPSFPVSSGTVSGRSYHFTMGASVNAICRSLLNVCAHRDVPRLQ